MIRTFVIFGASGDLTGRKLVPALYELFADGKLRGEFYVVGVSRTPLTDHQWADELKRKAVEFADPFDSATWSEFAKRLRYFSGDVGQDDTFFRLDQFLHRLESGEESVKTAEERSDEKSTRIYYLALAPERVAETAERLGRFGMARSTSSQSRRIVMEKPFGTSGPSARELNDRIHRVFEENQIYRIDHYLGKETVNNLFVLRFANTIFEPLWNRNYIDHIQITAGESLTVGGRGGYYDRAGILRDMFQNHLLQLLAITTMEAPACFDAESVRNEKAKVLRAIRRPEPIEGDASALLSDVVFGQYDGYQSEKNVAANSQTPTFAAIRLFIDNWRWKDVPIYLRSGKGMSCLTTQIVIQYKAPPHQIFRPFGGRSAVSFGQNDEEWSAGANRLLVQIQPAEGIRIGFLTKVPGTEMELKNGELVFSFGVGGSGRPVPAYRRLLYDVLTGDPSLFARDDEIEAAWEIIDPFTRLLDRKAETAGNSPVAAIHPYPIGNWGPEESQRWMANQNRRWFDLCPVIR